MSDDLEFDPMPDLGPQNDGEPAVVEAEAQAEEVQETAAPEQDTPAEEDAHEEPKKKTGSQRARERAARLEAENEALRRLLLHGQPKQEEPVSPPDGRPKAELFDSHEAWVEALADWKTEQKLAEREARRQQDERSRSWNEKANAARSKYEDFDEALQDAPAPAPHLVQALQDSPFSADLAYHLATHQDDYRRLSAMSPIAAAGELGRLEARFDQPKKPEAPRPQTKAPRPPAPVTAPPVPKPSEDGRLVVY